MSTAQAPAPGGVTTQRPVATDQAPPQGSGPAGTGGKADVKVTPDMIRKFAGLLREAAAPLEESESQLAAVNGLHAGWFPDGEDLRKFVGSGRDGRINELMQSAVTVRDQLRRLADKLDDVSRRYRTSEELNAHLVTDLAPVVGSFTSALSQAKDAGAPDATGGGADAPPAAGKDPAMDPAPA
ncbi:hypothetical protein ACGH2B_01905 [Streptomyces sp. BBFR2]|uniref:hypothetical protein n=1 Tax=Streptomyces sp. BBFR2 TaxID=3372854 RepID=UPI0037DA5BCF